MADYIYKERIPCSSGKDVECTHLEVSVYYSLGGYSYATCEEKPRGYYMSVTPVKIDGNWVSFTAFTGGYIFLNGCTRKSKKAEAEALRLMEIHKESIVKRICENHGITLKEKETA